MKKLKSFIFKFGNALILCASARRQLLQRGGSRVGGFPDLSGLPWEPAQRTGSSA